MKGKHHKNCVKNEPKCLCNTCKHDGLIKYGGLCSNLCCIDKYKLHCPIEYCPDYEQDDKEGDIE